MRKLVGTDKKLSENQYAGPLIGKVVKVSIGYLWPVYSFSNKPTRVLTVIIYPD